MDGSKSPSDSLDEMVNLAISSSNALPESAPKKKQQPLMPPITHDLVDDEPSQSSATTSNTSTTTTTSTTTQNILTMTNVDLFMKVLIGSLKKETLNTQQQQTYYNVMKLVNYSKIHTS